MDIDNLSFFVKCEVCGKRKGKTWREIDGLICDRRYYYTYESLWYDSWISTARQNQQDKLSEKEELRK